jgi:hypothetical protein
MTQIFAEKQYDSDATEIIDINLSDPISQLVFQFQIFNSLAANMTLHYLACIPKIELVDGSEVLFSLSGLEADALDWYNNKGFRANYNYGNCPGWLTRYVGINFGRYLWDKNLAFDPTKFKNPQLKVSFDINGGGATATYNKMAINALCFDEESISPFGFLMSKEIKNYTPGGTGHEYTDMPTDYPYRKLLVKCQTAGTEPNQLISNIKLSEEQDKRIPYDHDIMSILGAIMSQYPRVEETYWMQFDTSDRIFMITPTTRVTAFGTVWAMAAAHSVPAMYDGDGGQLDTIADANPSNMMVRVEGWLPHGVIAIPFGDQNDPDEWYDTRILKSLRADITSVAAAGGIQLFLEQLRNY